ncbi:MAG TPA: glycosyltransferase family 1 protein [Solibacterales bacterium]|nr:glycosyltransferase family 1 protein [Bryobacterales bacterium]
MTVALDATYSLGRNLSGVGAYCRALLYGLAREHPDSRFLFCYRSQRLLRAFREPLPRNAARRLLHEWAPAGAGLFHGLNQRLPPRRFPRVVTTFHDLFVMTGEYSTPEFRRRFSEQAREAAAGSDVIITVSAFTAAQVEGLLGVPRERIRVIPHGVEMPPEDERGGPREPLILHVGALQARKNIARLVAAFERIRPPWRLVLAGSDGYGAAEIRAAIAASPARERIDVPGYVSGGALRSLYRRASVLAFPSLDEGFGMPLLEAMAWGLPAVTSRGSALQEVAGDAALLVDPASVEEIAGGLARLIEDGPLRAKLIERGLAKAASSPWGKAVADTWRTYGELL